MTGMSIAGAGAFSAPPAGCSGVGFGVDRNHAGGRGGRNAAGGLGLQFSNAARRGEQGQSDRVGAERVESAGGGLIEKAELQRRNQCVQGTRTCRRVAHAEDIRACALPAQGLNHKILRKSCRRVKCYQLAMIGLLLLSQ